MMFKLDIRKVCVLEGRLEKLAKDEGLKDEDLVLVELIVDTIPPNYRLTKIEGSPTEYIKKEIKEEDKELEYFDYEDLYEDFKDICDLLYRITSEVIEAGDLETLFRVERVFDDEEQYARRRDVTKKINEKLKQLHNNDKIIDEGDDENEI